MAHQGIADGGVESYLGVLGRVWAIDLRGLVELAKRPAVLCCQLVARAYGERDQLVPLFPVGYGGRLGPGNVRQTAVVYWIRSVTYCP